MVPHRRIPLVEINLHAAAGLGGNVPPDGLQLFLAEMVGLLPIGSEASLQHRFSADGVADSAGGHLAEQKCSRLRPRQGVHHGVGPAEVLHTCRHGVQALAGPGEVDAFSGDGDRHLVGPCHEGAGTGIDPPRREARP